MEKLCNIKTMKLKKRAAFTLIELLMVAAIVAYALSAILATFRSTFVLNEASRNLTTATIHAEYILENVKNTAFAGVASSVNNGIWNWNATSISTNGLIALNSESITTTAAGTNPLTVTVTVSWNDLQGRSRTKALQTLVSG